MAGEVSTVDALAPLTGGQLLALQLLALGYSAEQVAALRGVSPSEVASDLVRAALVLGAAGVGEAIAVARERGAIIPAPRGAGPQGT